MLIFKGICALQGEVNTNICVKTTSLIISTVHTTSDMIGTVSPLLAAIAYGSSVVLVRKNLDESNVLNVALA